MLRREGLEDIDEAVERIREEEMLHWWAFQEFQPRRGRGTVRVVDFVIERRERRERRKRGVILLRIIYIESKVR